MNRSISVQQKQSLGEKPRGFSLDSGRRKKSNQRGKGQEGSGRGRKISDREGKNV